MRPGHLSPSVNPPFSFPLVDSSGGLDGARSPAAKHLYVIYLVKQPYKIHIDVKCTTRYTNQRAYRVQPLSAELTLWITGHL